MSNRQARREQARTSRTTRTTRTAPGGQRRPSSSGGGGSNVFSRGFLLALAGMAVVAVVAVVLVIVFNESDSESLAKDIEEATAALPLDLANGSKLGRDDAPVKIVAYEDFQCPFCLRYTAEQEPQIVEELVKTGKVQLEFRHLPILRNESVSAAVASQCAADQNKFWQYHHKLFLTQAEAGQANDEELNVGRFSDDNLKKFAKDLGLDSAQFDQCFDTREHLDLVTEHQREANQFGITGTPGFTVNGQPIGAGTPSNIDAWKQLVANVEGAIATATANATLTPAVSATTSPAATAAPSATPTPTPTRAP